MTLKVIKLEWIHRADCSTQSSHCLSALEICCYGITNTLLFWQCMAFARATMVQLMSATAKKYHSKFWMSRFLQSKTNQQQSFFYMSLKIS